MLITSSVGLKPVTEELLFVDALEIANAYPMPGFVFLMAVTERVPSASIVECSTTNLQLYIFYRKQKQHCSPKLAPFD